MKQLTLFALPVVLSLALAVVPAGGSDYFAIQVVDEATGRGVPLVELRTVHNVVYVTDSAGRVAFLEPGLMNDRVHFEVRAHGYEFPADGFGYRGFVAHAVPGGSMQVEVKRVNIAERLYRLTGGGIYSDTHLLSKAAPMEDPLLNGRVLGQDSTMAVEYRGGVSWFWGDTMQPSYPLGNFQMAGATSAAGEELDPEVAIDYEYFTDEHGFAREMAPIPGEGPTWLGGLTVLREADRERLVGGYAKIRGGLETYARGLVIYDDEQELFLQAREMTLEEPLYPIGHSLVVIDGDEQFAHFTNPLPLVRVRAELHSFMEPEQYQAFTPLVAGSRRQDQRVERDEDGNIVWAWKTGTSEVGPGEQEALVEAGVLQPEERLFAMYDWKSGEEVKLHAGSVNWNPYRGRWILIASEIYGESVLGEVWFAEADSPLGQWVYGQKIVSHDDYTFYNPRHHPFLDREGGRFIYFEGTYTQLFSGAPEKTPRYDYNQILYRLDLADTRLDLPVALYRTSDGCIGTATGDLEVTGRPLFWAWEREGDGRVGIRCTAEASEECHLERVEQGAQALFFVLEEREEADEPAVGQRLEKIDSVAAESRWLILPHPMPRGPVLPPVMGPAALP